MLAFAFAVAVTAAPVLFVDAPMGSGRGGFSMSMSAEFGGEAQAPPALAGLAADNLPMFGGVWESAPAGVPEALRPVWDAAVKECAMMFGQAPWPQRSMPFALGCGEWIQRYLIRRYGLQLKATHLVVETVEPNEAIVYDLVKGVWGKHPAASADEVRAALRAAGGKLLPPQSGPFRLLAADPLAAVRETEPAPAPKVKACDALPAAVTFEKQTPTSKAVAQAVEALKGTGASRTCKLTYRQHREDDELGELLDVTLNCGDRPVTGVQALSVLKKSGAGSMARLLASLLSDAMCSPAPKGR